MDVLDKTGAALMLSHPKPTLREMDFDTRLAASLTPRLQDRLVRFRTGLPAPLRRRQCQEAQIP